MSKQATTPTTAAEIIELAGTTLSALSIRAHQRNYAWLAVRIEDGTIADAEYRDDEISEDSYYINPEWSKVWTGGTGSCACNCDACLAGDDPADWAGSADDIGAIEDAIQDAIDALI
jgi:hypothetical protein